MAIDRSKYKSVDMRTDRSWPEKDKDLTEGDSIEGVLMSVKEDVGVNHSNVYVLRTPEGELVGVWGSTVLDARMSVVRPGQTVAIEYLGKKAKKDGKGKPYKDFFVGVDTTIPIEDVPQAAPSDPADDDQDADVPF